MLAQYVANFPIVKAPFLIQDTIIDLVNKLLNNVSEETQKQIDDIIYKLYNISIDEQLFIRNRRL